MKRIGVIGAGHVGLVTGACFAKLGNTVVVADNDAKKIAGLKKLRLPFFEPGLDALVRQGVKKNLLAFTTSIAELTAKSEVIWPVLLKLVL